MAQFNIAEAKARLPELIEKAALGEDIIVTNRNKPLARIVALRPARRRPGTGKGRFYFSPLTSTGQQPISRNTARSALPEVFDHAPRPRVLCMAPPGY